MTRRRPRVPREAAGLVAIGVIAIGSYLAFAGHGVFTRGQEVEAMVRGAPELTSRTPVRIAGVDVGHVQSMERGPGSYATLTLELEDQALPLHRDATLKIRPRTFLEGGFFVDLRPGTPSTPELEGGGVIPPANTSVPVLLRDVQNPLVAIVPVGTDLRADTRHNLRLMLRGSAQALDGGGAEALHASLPHLAPALRGFAVVSESARGERDGDLAGAVRGSAATVAALAARDEQLPGLVTGLTRTLRALGTRREQVGRSLVELEGVLREAPPALAEVNRLFPAARAFAAEVRPGVRELPATLSAALPFLDQAGALLAPSELPALLAQADPAVASLARLERPLAKVLGLVTPVTECLRRSAVPALKQPIEDPPHSTGDPVYRDLLHSLVGFSSMAQNFDGNGTGIRLQAGLGEETVTTGVPGAEEAVVGLASEPILGSRPRFTGAPPPFEPDVACVTQDPPQLEAETGPAPQQASLAGGPASPRPRALRRLLEGARR